MTTVYLAGKIQKAHEKPNETYWTENDQVILQRELGPEPVFFLNPAFRSDDLSDQKSVFGRDMTQVFSADFVFVDARDRRGLGVGAEMMWAKMNRIPLICLSPEGSHYHKSKTSLLGVEVEGWVHPFVESLSDAVVSSLEEGAKWWKTHLQTPFPIKGAEFIQEAMGYYVQTQFPKDEPMKDLASKSSQLDRKILGLSLVS